ncbi:MAG: protein-(glutamine-N5) methyltransferase, release factor-specific [Legionella sp.]|nr:MAG: protein-(glutamine-N5) methyltransferase, release factor-specific [Legionella sp.]PJD98512.1 MAG: protein-(glutamine-N5) methyltransferase, release factor-specific [Legionella sp.]
MNDIGTALTWATSLLLEHQLADARLDAEILLARVLNKNRAYLLAFAEQALTASQKNKYQQFITQRAQGIPIAYILKEREFWSLSLSVNEHTLIPRHETEQLVDIALQYLPQTASIQLLDLGTGSGAIALALAHERPQWCIHACDKSLEALAIAKSNGSKHQLTNIQWYHSDWFTSLPPQHYDAILSNPPYIAAQDPHLTQGDVFFEPRSALVSEDAGLADLQFISTQSIERLKPGGLLLLEHGYDQKEAIQAILNKLGYINVQCWQDLSGQDRISGGWKPL